MLHRIRPRRCALAALALCAIASFGVPIRDLAAQEKGTPATGDCKRRLDKIRAAFQAVPAAVGGLTAREADTLALRVIAGLREAENYTIACANTAEVPEAHYYAVKFLHLLSKRQQTDIVRDIQKTKPIDPSAALKARMAPFYRKVAQHADAAFKGLKDEDRRSESLQLLGWARSRLGKHELARDVYLKHRQTFPKSRHMALVMTALGRVYLDLEEFDTGIAALEKTMQDPNAYESEYYPDLGEVLWKLYERKGDLKGMQRCAERILSVYPLRAKSSRLTSAVREKYDRYVDVFGFRKAYALFALGRTEEARDAFTVHVARIDAKRDKLRAKGGDLQPVTSIYRERSARSLEFIERRLDRPAPQDFDLDRFWVTDQRTTIGDSAGKVIAVVFRGTGDQRSLTFLDLLDEYASQEDDVELVTVSYLKSLTNIDEQLDKLRAELVSLEYESAGGIDPDGIGKKVFRAYGAFVGSATFVIIDRRGQPAWFQQDPRTVDVNFAKALLERLKKAQ